MPPATANISFVKLVMLMDESKGGGGGKESEGLPSAGLLRSPGELSEKSSKGSSPKSVRLVESLKLGADSGCSISYSTKPLRPQTKKKENQLKNVLLDMAIKYI